jgi:Sigma-70 region 2
MQPECSENTALLEDALSAFVSVRPRLFGIAYRILESVAEAEDIVQDAWLRWQTTDRSVILDAPAFLATMTTRLAINRAQSARSRHETYIGMCLPEPVDTSNDVDNEAEQAHSCFTFVATLTGAKGPHHSRLISPYLSHCSAVSQIGRLSGHSKYIEPEKKLGTINLGNTSRYIDKSFDGMPSVPLT